MPSFLRQQAEAGLGLRERVGRVEEQLGGVVAGLAVDLDAAGEVGRPVVVEPVVVGEPRAGLGDHDELAGALVVEAVRACCSRSRTSSTPGSASSSVAGARQVGGVGDVDVGDLVVGDGERARRPRVEVLHPGLGVDLEQAGAAQGPVDVDGPVGRLMPYSETRDDGDPGRGGVVEQGRQRRVELGGGPVGRRRDAGPKRCRS